MPSNRKGKAAVFAVEALEGRALLAVFYPLGYTYPVANPVASPVAVSNPGFSPPTPTPAAAVPHRAPAPRATGIATVAPRFYEDYTGPKLRELNAVRATGELSRNGTFTFTGTNQGPITQSPAVYVWGIDRSGNLPAGTFTGRPNIKFDAVVVVTLDASMTPTAKVTDLTTGTTTPLPAGSASVRGKTVSVTVPESLLPSTGLAPSQYRFNYWPEDGGPPQSSSVASFAPEATTAQVGNR